MPAYIIVDIKIHDPVRYEDYKKMTPESLKLYEGKFSVRGGKTEMLEGEWSPQRIVILEFPTTEKAKAWWNSPEYAAAKKLRQEIATTEMLLVEGF